MPNTHLYLSALFSLANAILKLLTGEAKGTLNLKGTSSAVQAYFLSSAILVYFLLLSLTLMLLLIKKANTSFFYQLQSVWFGAFSPCQIFVPMVVLQDFRPGQQRVYKKSHGQ